MSVLPSTHPLMGESPKQMETRIIPWDEAEDATVKLNHQAAPPKLVSPNYEVKGVWGTGGGAGTQTLLHDQGPCHGAALLPAPQHPVAQLRC